jgi:hypothetical protein
MRPGLRASANTGYLSRAMTGRRVCAAVTFTAAQVELDGLPVFASG